jgi:hypothetical protein
VLGFTSIEKKTPDHRPLARVGLVCRRTHRAASSSMKEVTAVLSFSEEKKKITTSIE